MKRGVCHTPLQIISYGLLLNLFQQEFLFISALYADQFTPEYKENCAHYAKILNAGYPLSRV